VGCCQAPIFFGKFGLDLECGLAGGVGHTQQAQGDAVVRLRGHVRLIRFAQHVGHQRAVRRVDDQGDAPISRGQAKATGHCAQVQVHLVDIGRQGGKGEGERALSFTHCSSTLSSLYLRAVGRAQGDVGVDKRQSGGKAQTQHLLLLLAQLADQPGQVFHLLPVLDGLPGGGRVVRRAQHLQGGGRSGDGGGSRPPGARRRTAILWPTTPRRRLLVLSCH